MTTSRSLAHISTQRLLQMRDRAASAYRKRLGLTPGDYGYSLDGWLSEVSVVDIKAELAGREHVPNKIERKAARRAAARSGARSTRGAR